MADYQVPLRLELLPVTARVEARQGEERLVIGDCELAALADRYGTPLYLYDQATLDSAVDAYRRALARAYPGESGITYAGKAFLCVALAQWVHSRNLWLDCTGAGELAVAAAAGVGRESILVHGVNKSQEDLVAALSLAGTIVVDNLLELKTLAVLLAERQGITMPLPHLWLRIRPGLAVATHTYTQTGQEDSKFGMGPMEARRAVQVCRHHGLPLTGLHFHLGSHFRDPDPLAPALEMALDLSAALRDESGWLPQVLCPGGGWGCAYHEDELPHPPLEGYVEFVAERLVRGCQCRSLPLPRLQLEPGRSLVARAGVALYRVGTVKETPQRRWLLLDGGLADNPRPALYRARYSALPVVCPNRPTAGLAWLAGPYCESGDVLIEALPFPEVDPGECVAVPVSGAYHLSMASNYNGARRPAVVWLAGGSARLIQERQEIGDLMLRDLAFSGTDLDMIASGGG
jgi:diaminopimelate decarboxylase